MDGAKIEKGIMITAAIFWILVAIGCIGLTLAVGDLIFVFFCIGFSTIAMMGSVYFFRKATQKKIYSAKIESALMIIAAIVCIQVAIYGIGLTVLGASFGEPQSAFFVLFGVAFITVAMMGSVFFFRKANMKSDERD